MSYTSNRIENWIKKSGDDKYMKDQTKYRTGLTPYWYDWQQTAIKAGFDFELLENLPDARAIRFYELTKLLRVTSYDETTNNLPGALEIDYE